MTQPLPLSPQSLRPLMTLNVPVVGAQWPAVVASTAADTNPAPVYDAPAAADAFAGTRSRAAPAPLCTRWAPALEHAGDCPRAVAAAAGAVAAGLDTRCEPSPTAASSATVPRAART